MSISTLSFNHFRVEDDEDSLIVHEMDQDEVFRLIDNFYDDPLPRPATPASEFVDDEFAGLMDDLEEIENSTQQFDSDVVMHGVSSPLHSTILGDQEPQGTPHTQPHTPTTAPEMIGNHHTEALHDAIPPSSLPMTHLADGKTLATGPEITEERQPQIDPLSEASVREAASLPHSPEPLEGRTWSSPPSLPSAVESDVSQDQDSQTPSLPPVGRLLENARGSSLAPSTGGHRSSMHGEMRQEEEELSKSELGDLPPFPGFQTKGNVATEHAIDSSAVKGNRAGSYDLSSSRDIGVAKSLSKQQMASLPPSLGTKVTDKAAESPLSLAATKNLKRGRQASSPSFTPAKKARRLSPAPALEPPQVLVKQAAKVTKGAHVDESESSLSEISLSAIQAMTPEQNNGQPVPKTDTPMRDTNRERKDSVATSLQAFKAETPISPDEEETAVKQAPAKSKTAPKQKRNTKQTTSSASPAPTKATKITKVTKTAAKTKKPTALALKAATPTKSGKAAPYELKNIIEAGVLSDVFKHKGPRQTRGEKKALAETRPDPAQAAKRRHTDVKNYKE